MTKVSVIVPVYNVAKFLPQCLESLINQTLTDMEIICINDGSTDNSLDILNSYAKKDNRIIIIDKENSGVSASRNIGLDRANGEYVMFLDSDDYFVSPDSCQKAFDTITSNNADIGIFGYYDLLNETELEPSFRTLKLKQMIKGETEIDYYTFQSSIWDKIYRLSFLRKNNIKFVEGLKTAENVIFCFMTKFANPKYFLFDEILYVYRTDREGSVTTSNFNAVKSNFESLKYFVSTKNFSNQTTDVQLKVVDRFLGGALYFYNKNGKNLIGDINKTLGYIEQRYDKKSLKKLSNYHPLKKISKGFWAKLTAKIFSIVNSSDKKHKIVTFLGIKFKFRRKK